MEALTPELGADPHDIAAVQAVAAALDGALIILTGPDPALTYAVAEHAAHTDAGAVFQHRSGTEPPDDTSLDIHHGAPSGATWTVGEVEELILRPARLRPLHRAHVLVAEAHRMPQLASDRLLKALEEPRTDVLFWFCTPTADQLPATLRSRAARTLTVRPLPTQERLAALVATGQGAQDASRILAGSGDNARLAFAVARTGTGAHLATYAHTIRALGDNQVRSPSQVADNTVVAICALAGALGAPRRTRPGASSADARAAWERLDTRGKAEARGLLRELLDRAADSAERHLLTAHTARDVDRIAAALHAAHAAHSELDINAHPVTVLGAFLSRVQAGQAAAD